MKQRMIAFWNEMIRMNNSFSDVAETGAQRTRTFARDCTSHFERQHYSSGRFSSRGGILLTTRFDHIGETVEFVEDGGQLRNALDAEGDGQHRATGAAGWHLLDRVDVNARIGDNA
jgi:hypothetical protein